MIDPAGGAPPLFCSIVSPQTMSPPPTEMPSEWAAIRLKSVSSPKDSPQLGEPAHPPKETHESGSSSGGGNYAAVKLRSAPKPTDFCPSHLDPSSLVRATAAANDTDDSAAGGKGGSSVYDTIRASLKKVQASNDD